MVCLRPSNVVSAFIQHALPVGNTPIFSAFLASLPQTHGFFWLSTNCLQLSAHDLRARISSSKRKSPIVSPLADSSAFDIFVRFFFVSSLSKGSIFEMPPYLSHGTIMNA